MGGTHLGAAVVFAGYGLGCLVAGWYLVRLRTGRDFRTLATGGRMVRPANTEERR